MSPSSTASFDIDDLNLAVAEEWYPIPMTPGKGTARWAKDLAATLAAGDEAKLLASHLDDVRSRLMMLKDANMSAAVYLPHASLGVIDCLLTYTVAGNSAKSSATAFLRQAEEQEGKRSPGTYVHDVKTWRDTVAAGKLAGARTVNSYQELGGEAWEEERVVVNVYPTKARQFVQLVFTTSAPDSFSDLPLFATDVARQLEVTLVPVTENAEKKAHLLTSAHPVDNGFERALTFSRSLYAAGIVFIALAFLAMLATLVLISIADAPVHDPSSTSFLPRYLIADAHSDAENWIRIAPAVLLLLATCCLIPAELLRRGAWSQRETTFFRGGSNVVALNALPVRTHVAWLTAAFAAWVVLVPVPVFLYVREWWPATLEAGARGAAWYVLAFNGSIAALLCGISAASLLKKKTYDARATAGAAAIDSDSRDARLWRWFSHRWRMELTLGGVGAILLGLVPVLGVTASPAGAAITGVIGLCVAGLSVYLCLNAWRSGEDLHQVESVS
ncbi:hypothetical protein [Parafrigoribacterium soli]|uniref:hypothetical protein n=1 Tax=Parafrigoribacterium soli TaxID=3144663 RepID=UPI0032EE57C1